MSFSFTYDGVDSATLLATWPRTETTLDLGDGRTQVTVEWRDPASGLAVALVTTRYADFPTTTWTVHFTNTGAHPTPTLGDVLAIDLTLPSPGHPSTDCVIHTAHGNDVRDTDFAPLDVALEPGSFRTFTNLGGMSTQGSVNPDPTAANVGGGWPYYNIDSGGRGVIVALGWPGQWAMQIDRPEPGTLRLRGGMSQREDLGPADEIDAASLTEMWLPPGESIQTPLIALQQWSAATWIDAQNTWRRWVITHLVPRRGGELPAPVCATQANDYFEGQIDTADDEVAWLDAYSAHHATVGTGGVHDHWWIDAGWYQTPPNWRDLIQAPWPQWEMVGTWAADPVRFPAGLKPIVDRARQLGMSTVLWFEPERVMAGTWLHENHPDWLLAPPPGFSSFWGPDGAFHLDFGNPDALRWAIDHFGALLGEHEIDIYREDSNYPFLPYWVHHDPPGRRGITQIRYVVGHLAYWDALRERHPNILIDNSAGSGHRLDLELVRRSVSLIHDDKLFDATANQCHTYGIRHWIPWTGSATRVAGGPDDVYNARSNMGMAFHAALDVTAAGAAEWSILKGLAAEWRELTAHFFGDYYPLTPHSTASDAWMAWQFHRPDLGAGHIQCFARPDVPTATALTVRLQGLDAEATYRVWDIDDKDTSRTFRGTELMTTGIEVAPVPRPYAATLHYLNATNG
ncbi:alpha-galactosidase [Asanoa sp. NPDC049573]|uniref:alpha-galactosidase n=1 Tax=Asanoa sp. NPDC049573 TaxID=3155396 RepID=UPI00341481FB